MKPMLTKAVPPPLYYYRSGVRIEGPHPDLRGNVHPELQGNVSSLWGDVHHELRGNVSSLRGDVTDLRGEAVLHVKSSQLWDARVSGMNAVRADHQDSWTYDVPLFAAPPAALAVPADAWIKLYRRAVNVANALTNYVEDRPGLKDAQRKLEAIQHEAGALLATNKENYRD